MQQQNYSNRKKTNRQHITKVILRKPNWLLVEERRDERMARKRLEEEAKRREQENLLTKMKAEEKAKQKERQEHTITRCTCSGALIGIIGLFIITAAPHGWFAGIFGAIFGGLVGSGLGWLIGNITAYSER